MIATATPTKRNRLKPQVESQLFNTKDAAYYIGISVTQFCQIKPYLLERGITPVKLPQTKYDYWKRKQLDEYIDSL